MSIKRITVAAIAALGLSLGAYSASAGPVSEGVALSSGKAPSTFTLVRGMGGGMGGGHMGGFGGGHMGGFGGGHMGAMGAGRIGGMSMGHFGGPRFGATNFWVGPRFAGRFDGGRFAGRRFDGGRHAIFFHGRRGFFRHGRFFPFFGVGLYGYDYGYGYGGGSCYWNCRSAGYSPGYCNVYAYNFCY